jgi:hypothetical protein
MLRLDIGVITSSAVNCPSSAEERKKATELMKSMTLHSRDCPLSASRGTFQQKCV